MMARCGGIFPHGAPCMAGSPHEPPWNGPVSCIAKENRDRHGNAGGCRPGTPSVSLQAMCDHAISRHVSRSGAGPTAPASDGRFALEVYEAHAAELYGVVVRLVGCADCADHVLARTFLGLSAEEDGRPTLVELIRVSLKFACGASEGRERDLLQKRIRAWYMETHLGIPEA